MVPDPRSGVWSLGSGVPWPWGPSEQEARAAIERTIISPLCNAFCSMSKRRALFQRIGSVSELEQKLRFFPAAFRQSW